MRKVTLSIILEEKTEFTNFLNQTIINLNSGRDIKTVLPGDTLTLNLPQDKISPTVLIRIEGRNENHWEIVDSVSNAQAYLLGIGIYDLSECSMDLETAILLEKYRGWDDLVEELVKPKDL